MAIAPLLAVSAIWMGNYSKALAIIRAMQELAASTQLSPLERAHLKIAESMYYLLTGDRQTCLGAVNEGLLVTEEHGIQRWGKQLQLTDWARCLVMVILMGQDAAAGDRVVPQRYAAFWTGVCTSI